MTPVPPATRRRFATVVALLAAVGALSCVAVIVAALIRQQPTPGLGYLIVPGAVVLVVGQVATLVWMFRARRRDRQRARPGGPVGSPSVTSWLTNGLGGGALVVLLLLCVGGALAAATGVPLEGQPAPATPECAYPLTDRGRFTACVSEAEYVREQARAQRFVAGVLLCFFSAHAAVALTRRTSVR